METFEDHRSWCSHLHDLGMLSKFHRVCLFAQKCIAEEEEE